MNAKINEKKTNASTTLQSFIREFNEIYYSNLYKDTTSDIFSEIRNVEKIVTNPKFHPTSELRSFYKQMRESYASPFRIMLIGGHEYAKILFINVLLKDSIIPLHNALSQKRFIIKYAKHRFVIAHYKNYQMSINLHAFELTNANLEEIEYFEIFVNEEILKNIEIYKTDEDFNKKWMNYIKDVDLILWILELKTKITNQDILQKIIKKKQVITILTHTNKELQENELLEQISSDSNYLDENFGLNQVYDIDLCNLFYGYKLDEKSMFQKSFGLLNKQVSLRNKSLEGVMSMLDNTKSSIESFFHEKQDIALDKIQQDKLDSIIESLQKSLQSARVKRGMALLKDALDKNKIIDSYYKILFEYYKMFDNDYHKATLTLCAQASKLYNEYNKEVFISISRNIKKYLDSMIDSILDNMEEIRISTRPSNPSFFDNITNRKIIYTGYQINQEEIMRELDDPQSIIARKHKNLLTKISRFISYVSQNIDDNLESFGFVVRDWIGKGHHLVLRKRPAIVSMDRYLSLEEFNLSVYSTFTKRHNEIMREFGDRVKTRLSALSIWVQATRKVMLECVMSRLEKKFLYDKYLAKNARAHEIQKIDRDALIDIVLDLLPHEIHALFCQLPGAMVDFANIPLLLHVESKEREKALRYRIKELIDLRKSMKVATKMLDSVIVTHSKLPAKD